MTRRAADVAGLRVAVTGGSSGIGAAVVRMLVDNGGHAVALDVAAPPDDFPAAHLPCDVTDGSATRTAVDAAAEALRGLDALVNCAGIGAVGTVEDGTDADWARVLDVNVTGLARTSRAAIPHLRGSSAASIVNLGSFVATTATTNRALYSASKGAVQALTLAMAADLAEAGIRVNCVNPGTVDTPWVARLMAASVDPDATRAELEARQPIGRLVSADEVAAAVCYLLGHGSGAVTGATLAVDGGITGIRFGGRRAAVDA